ncbi:MAG: flagellar filament capping protein FliD [Pirellulales bacterium]|nr:flagellar filament capping protein FliD [Pirellulales bacterium]
MGRITSNVGLISGIPIQETVEKLIALQARPRDLIVDRNKGLESQQVALTEISAMLLSMQLAARRLGQSTLFQQRTAISSSPDLVSVTASNNAALGVYQFTPLRLAQSHQVISTPIASKTSALPTGSFSFGFGGFVNGDTNLDVLGGGTGLERGKIRITDRSGASAEIDLTRARTTNDVLTAINSNGTISVRAELHGDRLRLVDLSGESVANLRVQEVGGATAASLGLAGINVAASQADGQDVVRLFDQLRLDRLNGGNGVRFDHLLADMEVRFRDSSSPLTIDFARLARSGTRATTTTDALDPNARVVFTAVEGGSAYEDVEIVFEDDANITAGNETVFYDDNDPQDKRLVFKIDAGNTTAAQIRDALNRDATASKAFKAALPSGANGTSAVSVTDTAVTAGPPATATTPGHSGAHAQIAFTAVQPGSGFDDVTIEFQYNPSVNPGEETVQYDDSDPDNKRLVFQINDGGTTAANVIAALNNDPVAGQIFHAANANGNDGSGLILDTDTTITSGGALVEPLAATNELTLGEVLAVLNAADPARLRAEIAPDGDRILLTDLTADNGGTFEVVSLNGSKAAEDLGLAAAASSDTITGGRLFAGFNTALLRNLNGGKGLGTLGTLSLTDRSGASATVDLSTAETLQEVIDAINAAGIGIEAAVNSARNGISLADTTGSTVSNLIVSNVVPASQTAEKLSLAINATVTSVNSQSLRLQSISENTLLSSYNGGAGVTRGTVKLTDTAGVSGTLNLADESIQTIGDVLTAIRRLGIGIEGRINERGDGILLVDTAHGSGTMAASEGSSNTARDLHLLGQMTIQVVDSVPTKVIDGTTTFTVELDGTRTLDDVVSLINSKGVGVTSTLFNDGSLSGSYRFTLLSSKTGTAAELLIDTSNASFNFSEISRAQDALLYYGAGSGPGGVIAASSSNGFADLVGGLSVTILGTSSSSVSVSVSQSDANLTTAVQSFVDSYNKIRTRIDTLTAFNATTGAKGVLQGDSNLQRLEGALAEVLSGRFAGTGAVQSLGVLGIKLGENGQLSFDANALKTRFTNDPTAVEQLFTNANSGVAFRLDELVKQFAASDNALLVKRLETLDNKLITNNERIDVLNVRLDKSRERLLLTFYRLEESIAKIQGNLSALSALQPLKPMVSA